MQEYYGKLLEKEKELQEMEEKRQEMLSIIQEVFSDGNNEYDNQEENNKIIENEKELKECLSEQEFNIIKNIVKEKVKFIRIENNGNKKTVIFDKLQISL